jgi:transposase
MVIPTSVIPEGLFITGLDRTENSLTIQVRTFGTRARCPLCHQSSTRLQGRYHRTLVDLPWADHPVYLQVTVRKFYCTNPSCSRKVFAERLDGVAEAHARRTLRQREALERIALALGGEAGARLASRLGLATSPDTLLRCIRAAPEPQSFPPRVLGVDDWAWKKRYRYGTILVDLERRRVMDLLQDSSSGSLAHWLERHPGVEVISRDRGGEYAEGARRGAPNAVQVADRFHLLKNLSEVGEKIFRRYSPLLACVPLPEAIPRALSPPRPGREAARQRTQERREERRALVHSLAQQGMSKSAIARATGFHRQTVGGLLWAEGASERPRHRTRDSILAPYVGYILERCRQGYWNAMGLWREIVPLGYPGKYKAVSRLVSYLRKLAKEERAFPMPLEGLTPRRAVGLLIQRREQRSEGSQSTIKALLGLHPEIARTGHLLERFVRMVRREGGEGLEEWLEEARGSGIAEMKGFATKLGQDLDAVLAGLKLPWSQGQTEGQGTKLKLIRRQMYGRGKFDLVRKRVLMAA